MLIKYIGRKLINSHDWGRKRYSFTPENDHIVDIPITLFNELVKNFANDFIPHVPPTKERVTELEIIEKKVYVCFVCHKEFPTSRAMIQHYKIDHHKELRGIK